MLLGHAWCCIPWAPGPVDATQHLETDTSKIHVVARPAFGVRRPHTHKCHMAVSGFSQHLPNVLWQVLCCHKAHQCFLLGQVGEGVWDFQGPMKHIHLFNFYLKYLAAQSLCLNHLMLMGQGHIFITILTANFLTMLCNFSHSHIVVHGGHETGTFTYVWMLMLKLLDGVSSLYDQKQTPPTPLIHSVSCVSTYLAPVDLACCMYL